MWICYLIFNKDYFCCMMLVTRTKSTINIKTGRKFYVTQCKGI